MCIITFVVAELCNGSTADSDSVCLGSNPSSAAKKEKSHGSVAFLFLYYSLFNIHFSLFIFHYSLVLL